MASLHRLRHVAPLVALVLGAGAAPSRGLIEPPVSGLALKAFSQPDLFIPQMALPLDRLPFPVVPTVTRDLGPLGGSLSGAFYDPRGDRWANLILTQPLVPGAGYGNSLTWQDLGVAPPATNRALETAVEAAFRGFISTHRDALRIDPAEVGKLRIDVNDEGRLIHVFAPHVFRGVPVYRSYLVATINSGNLILFGSHSWGAPSLAIEPSVSAAAAEATIASYIAPYQIDSFTSPAHLEILPVARGFALGEFLAGQGYGHRLAWILEAKVSGEPGTWTAWVDAANGQLLAFMDRNEYFERKITGGVYPVANDQAAPDGIELTGFPMPLADQKGVAGSFANFDGRINLSGTTFSTDLSGKYLRINDSCGAINESAPACGDLNLGSGPLASSTDCTVPAGHSAGDTKASRTGFFELNRLIGSVQKLLPTNTWLQGQLTANMNLNQTCNAYWDGSTVNFFKSGGGCSDTGEIAAVFDHEWGHGLDDNNTNNAISAPGEAIADINALMRLAQSCAGRGFFQSGNCTGFGDTCNTCSGVRDLDFAKHASGLPHDIEWILTATQSPGVAGTRPAGGCLGAHEPYIPVLQSGPCGMETHCEGYVPAETGWDLFARDLQGAPYGLDFSSALEVATHLLLVGANNLGDWYECAGLPNPANGVAGCLSDSGYMNVLATDDDNGNLNDGTPHMTGIFNAFHRHQIDCATLTVQDSGCAGKPTAAPVVTTAGLQGAATLAWNAVPNATKYYIYRSEGPHGCNFGKVRVGVNAGNTNTNFVESGLLPGTTYYYSVQGVGTSDSCTGPMSVCQSVVPQALFIDHCGGRNNLPVAVNDVATTDAGAPITIAVLANDSDDNGDTLTVSSVTTPAHGSVIINPDSTLRYTPNECLLGVDTFQYTVGDGFGGFATAQVTVTVTGGGGGGGGICFNSVTPCRAYDSRVADGPITSGTQKEILLGGVCGIPLTAKAVSLNVTATDPTSSGTVVLYPDKNVFPTTSGTVFFVAGQTRANNQVMALATSGAGTLVALPLIQVGTTVNVVVDVNGYFE